MVKDMVKILKISSWIMIVLDIILLILNFLHKVEISKNALVVLFLSAIAIFLFGYSGVLKHLK